MSRNYKTKIQLLKGFSVIVLASALFSSGCKQIDALADQIEARVNRALGNNGNGFDPCKEHGKSLGTPPFCLGLSPGNNGKPGEIPPGPEGSDLISSTTNFSRKVEDPGTKASGAAAAAFVAPPAPNNYGAVSLSYPLEIPPGRAGVQPGLSLSYTSNGGDGIAGIGWSIGLGAITRTTRYGQLYYDKRDTFTYAGKRLVKVSGSTLNENGIYRLEIESDFMRFELSDIENGGVWQVYGSDGTLSHYGDTTTSRIYNPGKPSDTYSWQFSRTEDRNGNDLKVVYDSSEYDVNRILYVQEIFYTGNTKLGEDGQQSVRFIYKKRSDPYVSKSPGFVMTMDRLLDRIEMRFNGTTLWDYELVYTTSPDSGRSLLKTVYSSRTASVPEFFYQNSSHTLTWQKVYNPFASDPALSDPRSVKYFEGDFNGDGISDLVFFNPQNGFWKAAEGRRQGGYNHKIYGEKFAGYDGPEKIQWFKGNVTGDYNGDGRSDIAFYLPESKEFWVAEHNGRTFQFRRYGALLLNDIDIFRAEWFPGDYDGNGLSDSVLFDEASGDWILMRNVGGAFEFIKFSQHFQNLFRDDYSPNFNLDSPDTNDRSAGGRAREKVHFLNGDYNGDGRTDISFYDERDGKWWVAENYIDDAIGFRLEWKLYKVFTAPEQTLFGHDRFSGDFNGDGYSDFLLFDRSSCRWIIGETKNSTIDFRIFSEMPEHCQITRWLQGDFNGDGRTDIGFYSESDQNFWIGEATPTQFRYRIYSNMTYGPDPARVMATPEPQAEVVLKDERSVIASASTTLDVSYIFDANPNKFYGEIPFVGCFTKADCSGAPELLFVDQKNNQLFLKDGASAPVNTNLTIPLGDAQFTVLNDNKAGRYTLSDRDEILYHELFPGSTPEHRFQTVRQSSGTNFQTATIGSFPDTAVTNFNLQESLYLIDHFDTGIPEKSLLVLDDQATPATFALVQNSTLTSLAIEAPPELLFENIFSNDGSASNRKLRANFSFISADFTNSDGIAEVLLVDRTGGDHSWHLGTIDLFNSKIVFEELSEESGAVLLQQETASFDPTFGGAGFYYRQNGSSITYAGDDRSPQNFYKLEIIDSAGVPTVSQSSHQAGSGLSFKNEYDHNGNPILYRGNSAMVFDLATNKLQAIDYSTGGYEAIKLEREDLYTQVYPFRWIQGDYNGDNKTDIGIFHLKEPTWYFANSVGDTPDIMEKVHNGIGGTYRLHYINSTSLDNTGVDDIPDLPMNYRVCSRIIREDGIGNSIETVYNYSGGFAFSAFVNGYKETDFFGFSRFETRDALGSLSISEFNTTPYADFRKNRALAGAIKRNYFLGTDQKKYSETSYEYQLHEINQGGLQASSSFLVNPYRVKKYKNNILTETNQRNVTIKPLAYELESITESSTDHYSDATHTSSTIANYTLYETDPVTNQQRPIEKRNFDASAFQTTFTFQYDVSGNVTRKTTTYTGTGLYAVAPRTIDFSYDSYGNLSTATDNSATPVRTNEYQYDAQLNQFVTTRRVLTDSGSLSSSYTFNYGAAFGQPDTTTDANGNQTYNDYDSYGRLIGVRADTENGIETLQSYSYNDSFPFSAKTIFYTGSSDPVVQFRKYTDGLGREIHTVRSAANGRFVRTGRITYDASGRVIRKSQTDWADASELESYKANTTEKFPTTYQYDASGRLHKTILPTAAGETVETSITTTYNDPWEVTTVHSGGKGKRTITNARGQVLYIEDFGTGDDGAAVTAKIGFCYDLAGNRIRKSDLNGGATLSCPTPATTIPPKDTSGNNVATWSFDAFGQLRQESDPDFGVSSYSYNEFGDLISTTDALNRTTTMSYDRLGRMTVKNLPGAEGTVLYTYDDYLGSTNSKGKLVVLNDPAQTKILSYDKLGRLQNEARILKNPTNSAADVPYLTTYRLDLMNRNIEIDYPIDPGSGRGSRVCYSYNAMGYISGIHYRTDASSGAGCGGEKVIIASTDYNEFGQVTTTGYGNGVNSDYSYDVKGRLKRIVSIANDGVSVKTLQDVSYTFAVDNNIESVANSADDYQVSYNYNYDGFNRLVGASGNYATTPIGGDVVLPQKFQRSYGYAQNGNLTNKQFHDPDSGSVTDSWSYNYNNHAVSAINSSLDGGGRFTMNYDAVGNMTTQSDSKTSLTKQLEYDSNNRIRRVLNSSGKEVARYEYDDQGFRVRRRLNQNGGRELLYPSKFFGMDVSGSISSINNVYFNGLRIAAITPDGSGHYFMTDQVDSVHLVLDDTGAEVSRMEYLPYGETFVQEGDTTFRPKYNSQELDEETNFYFYNARHYDPQIARFVTADTVIDGEYDTQGWNRYMYVKGNPIRMKDPTGHHGEGASNLGNPAPGNGGGFCNSSACAPPVQGPPPPPTGNGGAGAGDSSGGSGGALAPFDSSGTPDFSVDPGIQDPSGNGDPTIDPGMLQEAPDIGTNTQNPLKGFSFEGSKLSNEDILDGLQTVLETVGTIPAAGNLFDLANAGISLARGNYADAGSHLLSALPGGQVFTAARIANKVGKVVKKKKALDADFGSRREAFRAAKKYYDIPMSQQPYKTIKVKDAHGRGDLTQYNYRNNKGEEIGIRQDLPMSYKEGGRGDQGKHFNGGRLGGKLKDHFNYP